MKLSKQLLTSLLISSLSVVSCENSTQKKPKQNKGTVPKINNDSIKKPSKVEDILTEIKDLFEEEDKCPACGLG